MDTGHWILAIIIVLLGIALRSSRFRASKHNTDLEKHAYDITQLANSIETSTYHMDYEHALHRIEQDCTELLGLLPSSVKGLNVKVTHKDGEAYNEVTRQQGNDIWTLDQVRAHAWGLLNGVIETH